MYSLPKCHPKWQNLLFYLFLFIPLLTNAQSPTLDRIISINMENVHLADALDAIADQVGCNVSYNSSRIDLDKRVTINYKDISVGEAFARLLTYTLKKAQVSDKQIFLQLHPDSRGSLKGNLRTSDGKAAEFVNVSVKRSSKGTLTDENGEFVIRNIPAGQHTLIIQLLGYEAIEKNISVAPDQVLTLPVIFLREDSKTLHEVTVNGSMNKFANKESDYIARMPLKNLENPQVYSVVSSRLIKEQLSVGLLDVIRNAPGAVPVINPSGGFSAYLRGFGIGINARNGMESTSERSSLDIGNIERIEVLKGPSATLFGSSVSSYGGVVNLVTKKPFETTRTEISYTTGSYGLNRITADVNTPLNKEKTVLIRTNMALHKEKSFLDYGFNNTFLIATSLSYRASSRLTFNVDAEFLKVNNTQPMNFIIGSPLIKSPTDLQLDYRKTLYHNNADVKNAATRLFAEVNYKLSERFKSTTLFSYVEENVDHSYQRPIIWISPSLAVRASSVYGPLYNAYTNLQHNVNGRFNTGKVRHNLLMGANYRYFTGKFLFSEASILDTVNVTESFNPVIKQNIDPTANFEPFPTADQHTVSAYVSDVVNFTDRFSVMLGLRIDHFNRKEITGTQEGFKQTSLAPKLGIVYQILASRLSAFANYMSGFQNIAPAIQPDGSRLILDPQFANQAEGGLKAELFDKKLSASLSYYHILIDNATRVDADLFTVQDGKQVSKGVEFELIAQPVKGLNIVAGYAFNDNRIKRASNPAIEGNKAANAPENVANIWTSYAFQNTLKGFGLGAGINKVDKIYRATNNTFAVPAYTIVGATLFYSRENWGINLKANNLTNVRYWDSWGNPQAPANFAANLTFRF
ncbi:TonB-dependent receptor [Dyadobacter sp. CY312]|uniref:TonB-dependent receptor n=1 Tax=Dyadobacter sp. CY312 TaxID=2907303 RepID=UPI001F48CEAA|nr:TonB-dependent receptor [Dyadobacter sp. CY312]MCE7044492.1 TonB-dependent receptor [Dyadobacter sp. CY312]